eukprot:Gb_17119 [translate_table: standard]
MDTQDLEVPSYFRCPISMELMRDPVTVCTGVTYDRESIEKWIYSCNKKTCPATMQLLQNLEVTPNHTLRRLIQGWCVVNSSKGIDRIPTPKPPIDSLQVSKLLQDVKTPPFQINALRNLRSLARESERNRRCIVAVSGSGTVLASIVKSYYSSEEFTDGENLRACEEALGILYLLPMTNETAKLLCETDCIRSMALILQRGTSEARFHAVILLQSIAARILNWEPIAKKNNDIFQGLLELLTDEVSHQATVAALDILRAILCTSRRNRIRAIEAGAVFVLIELLPEAQKTKCEKMLEVLDMLLDCAEGRAALTGHAMGIAAVSKKILRVSEFATKKAVRILWSICIFSPNASILRDMVDFGAVSKLCTVLQLEFSSKTKQKATEVLKLHGNSWKKSPCFPLHLLNYYP